MASTNFLSVPLKKAYEVDLIKPLKSFISSTYTNANPDEYSTALSEFNKLRQSMISKSVDKHDSALEVLCRYHDQLVAIEGKFPIAENQIRINFKWQDAFDKESFFGGKRTLSLSFGGYEKVCVLFNIAAMQSGIAAQQSVESDDGLKMAAKLYQQAGGIFVYLKDIVLSHIQNKEPTPDISVDSLNAISALMIAQAQDCIYRKAVKDNMKNAVVAKLVHQTSDFYADAMKLLQLGSIREIWPKDWVSNVAGKQAAYHALAEYHQGMVAKEKKEFGEEIARLTHSMELMTAAENRSGGEFLHQREKVRIGEALKSAKKDNDFIYHAIVPDVKSLPAIGKAVVAKPIPVSAPMSSRFTDLFEKIVPLAVHGAMVQFENRRVEMVNTEIGRLREATQLMNSVMASLNLPAAIEDLSGNKVPPSVLEKAEKLRTEGGAAIINKLMSELPELLNRNREILDVSMNALNEEESSDKVLRDQFKERWTRTSSDKLTQPIRSEGTKYKQIIDNAIQADHVVKERYNKHKGSIELLSKPNADIEKALPAGTPTAALQGSPVIAELKQLCEQVETLKAERDVIETEIKDTKCDMTSKFMSQLSQDGSINEDSLSTSELDRVYGPLRQQVTDSVHRQESVLANIQRASEQFAVARSQNQAGVTREQKLKDLAAAYDSFSELKSNLTEGTKFYNDLTQLLVKFQSKVNDFCFARKTEKEELMKDLQNKIVNQPTSAPPAAPAHHQPTGEMGQTQGQGEGQGTRVPPPRPPPPSRPPAPQTVSATPAAPSAEAPPAAAASAPPPAAGAPPQPYPGAYSYPPQQPYGASSPPVHAQPPHAQPPHAQQQPQVSQGGYPAYGGPATPYPVYPAGGYAPPPMPQGYNPYAQYGGYPQAPPYPTPGGYPTYPQPQPGYPGQPGQPGQPQWR